MRRGDGLCCWLARLCSLCLLCAQIAAATACSWCSAATVANAMRRATSCNRWTLCSRFLDDAYVVDCHRIARWSFVPEASSGGLPKLRSMAWNGGLHGATKPDSASLDQPSRDLRDRSAAHTAAGGTTVTAGQQLLTTTPTRKQLRISRDTWLQITSTPCKAHNDCEAYVLRPAPRRGGGAATGSKTANSRHNGRRAAGR